MAVNGLSFFWFFYPKRNHLKTFQTSKYSHQIINRSAIARISERIQTIQKREFIKHALIPHASSIPLSLKFFHTKYISRFIYPSHQQNAPNEWQIPRNPQAKFIKAFYVLNLQRTYMSCRGKRHYNHKHKGST